MTSLRYRYQTIEFGKTDIHLRTLRNNQEFHDPTGLAEKLGISSASWPIFGVLWPSSLVLAHHLSEVNTEDKRILEVGCGIGLSSLLLNKQNADITATDYHPEVNGFLDHNCELNGDAPIKFHQADWAVEEDTLGHFDLIIGSDLLYEDEHINLLAQFINDHCRPHCEVIIVDPGRGRKNKMCRAMAAFGFESHQDIPVDTSFLELPFKGHILTFSR